MAAMLQLAPTLVILLQTHCIRGAFVRTHASFAWLVIDDACLEEPDGSTPCGLSLMQKSDALSSVAFSAQEKEERDEDAGTSSATTQGQLGESKHNWTARGTPEEEQDRDVLFTRRRRSAIADHPINKWNDQLDTPAFWAEGLYYQFSTSRGEKVWAGKVEGRPGSFHDATSAFPMASASKLFTAFAAMVSMELKPQDWYPGKHIHEFKGWESFRDFPISGTDKKANLSIHHLLTHTSGLPFGMRMSKEDIGKLTLAYEPGTYFGYTLGHRVIGWMLRDYWMNQPETKGAKIKTCQDAYKWLYYDKMGLNHTQFDDTMTLMFGYSGQAGDASISSTGEDFMRLAVTALRKGSTAEDVQLIKEENWNRWAVPNLLPGGKLSNELVSWQGNLNGDWANWDYGNLKEKIMQQSGEYGWNYFGATFHDSKETGWCGFFSSCMRISYENELAFILMQRDIADLKKSKAYLVDHFASMSASLKCSGLDCSPIGGPSVHCDVAGAGDRGRCPSSSVRGKGWHEDTQLDPANHSCYAPVCEQRGGWFDWWR